MPTQFEISGNRRIVLLGSIRRAWLPTPSLRCRSVLGLALGLLGQLGNQLEEIADDTVIRHLEDRRFLVLVDRDDDLAVLHAGEMLDGTGDADGDVEVGGHDLAGLADLPVVGRVAGIDRRAGRPDGGTDTVGELLDDLEVLGRADPTTTRDDDPGRAQIGPGARTAPRGR